MNLQKKLIQLSEYKCSFKYVESYFLVSMVYPENWSIIPCEDKSIDVAEEDGVTFYAAPIETDINKAFELIDDTISYNLDVEKKMNLLKFNINKLQEMFSTMDLEELETLEFVTTKSKVSKNKEKKSTKTKKVAKKVTSKKKKVEDTDSQQGDNLVESTSFVGFTDDTMYEPIDLNETVESKQTNNEYLEEVER
nr:MAG TPA: hypothetical protein [Ackermannviridae sp.]